MKTTHYEDQHDVIFSIRLFLSLSFLGQVFSSSSCPQTPFIYALLLLWGDQVSHPYKKPATL